MSVASVSIALGSPRGSIFVVLALVGSKTQLMTNSGHQDSVSTSPDLLWFSHNSSANFRPKPMKKTPHFPLDLIEASSFDLYLCLFQLDEKLTNSLFLELPLELRSIGSIKQ